MSIWSYRKGTNFLVSAAQVIQIKGKTEQRVGAVVSVLRDAKEALTYAELASRSGAPYDQLLYILATLVEVDLVERIEEANGPGRPKLQFKWIAQSRARAVGARKNN